LSIKSINTSINKLINSFYCHGIFMTFFDGVLAFDRVSTVNGISTKDFLTAAEAVVQLMNGLGPAFSVVSKDIQGNITKVNARFEQNKDLTLQLLVANDKARKSVEGLLWLKRALHFTASGLRRSLNNPTEELSVSFSEAYKTTLSPFHSFLIRPVFSVA
jgi:hypothetical protein